MAGGDDARAASAQASDAGATFLALAPCSLFEPRTGGGAASNTTGNAARGTRAASAGTSVAAGARDDCRAAAPRAWLARRRSPSGVALFEARPAPASAAPKLRAATAQHAAVVAEADAASVAHTHAARVAAANADDAVGRVEASYAQRRTDPTVAPPARRSLVRLYRARLGRGAWLLLGQRREQHRLLADGDVRLFVQCDPLLHAIPALEHAAATGHFQPWGQLADATALLGDADAGGGGGDGGSGGDGGASTSHHWLWQHLDESRDAPLVCDRKTLGDTRVYRLCRLRTLAYLVCKHRRVCRAMRQCRGTDAVEHEAAALIGEAAGAHWALRLCERTDASTVHR